MEKEKRSQDYYSISTIIKEVKGDADKEPTAREVLEFMIGDYDHWRGGDYVVYKYKSRKKRNLIQRINMLWIYPLFIVTIPLQYLFAGDWGLNRNSKIGKIVDYLVKF